MHTIQYVKNYFPFLRKAESVVYKICFKICFQAMILFKSGFNTGKVKTIPAFEQSPGLIQAGEDINHIWRNYRGVKGNLPKQSDAVFQRSGIICPSHVHGRSEVQVCFFL